MGKSLAAGVGRVGLILSEVSVAKTQASANVVPRVTLTQRALNKASAPDVGLAVNSSAALSTGDKQGPRWHG